MARIKIKGIDALRKRIDAKLLTTVNQTLRDKDLRKDIGVAVKKDIQDKTWRSAKRSTQKTRAYLERFNKTDRKYNRSNINVTFTGKLLNDLANNVIANTVKSWFIIQQSDKRHPPYRTANGRLRNSPTFKKLKDYLKDKDLDYLKFTLVLKKKIGIKVVNKLKKAFKKAKS